jgi:hypothetical protein
MHDDGLERAESVISYQVTCESKEREETFDQSTSDCDTVIAWFTIYLPVHTPIQELPCRLDCLCTHLPLLHTGPAREQA